MRFLVVAVLCSFVVVACEGGGEGEGEGDGDVDICVDANERVGVIVTDLRAEFPGRCEFASDCGFDVGSFDCGDGTSLVVGEFAYALDEKDARDAAAAAAYAEFCDAGCDVVVEGGGTAADCQGGVCQLAGQAEVCRPLEEDVVAQITALLDDDCFIDSDCAQVSVVGTCGEADRYQICAAVNDEQVATADEIVAAADIQCDHSDLAEGVRCLFNNCGVLQTPKCANGHCQIE